ncbi:MAG: M20/M25/M40 family metallo-hydrolase, partial [Caldilineaceae bacterium]
MSSPSSESARQHARANTQTYVDDLMQLLRIPSLSGDPARAAEVRSAAEWLVAHMRSLGLSNAAVMETAGHPVAYGEWLGAGPDAPTLLVYGHYDVVPASLEDGWATDPWEPTLLDGKIFARGATDDKGQLFIHVKALEAYLKTSGSAPVNVKFLIEGEEEVASPNLRPFIEEHLEMLKADVVVVSDTSMPTREEPAITHSLRGMTYLEFEVFGPSDDLHSGFFGGAT